ncbi:hypothetical protein [Mucilaginibacter terrae]|uniref:Uncharacterized protein n=1 Tax=Mucilaginibacter terrae TaxID=1955052 RepID=A0ABU3H1C1_9SPHI|nr:hypothetical protein [Mucilaginibacter terrae]MDT3405067.1 hypothetical protein [Mucilaginibacter terrae]
MKNSLLLIVLLATTCVANAQVITRNERMVWNGFVDYLASKNYKGSPELDRPPREKSVQLWKDYCKLNKLNLDYHEFVSHVQRNIIAYRNYAWSKIKSGKATFTGTEADFMPGLSTIDGWAGSRTTTYKFPPDSITVGLPGDKIIGRSNAIYAELHKDTVLLNKQPLIAKPR